MNPAVKLLYQIFMYPLVKNRVINTGEEQLIISYYNYKNLSKLNIYTVLTTHPTLGMQEYMIGMLPEKYCKLL